MFRTWASQADDLTDLARALEAHLNEFAEEVVSVAYAVTDLHYVLAVYRQIEGSMESRAGEAIAVAEQILDESPV